jgi:hypothetical protein
MSSVSLTDATIHFLFLKNETIFFISSNSKKMRKLRILSESYVCFKKCIRKYTEIIGKYQYFWNNSGMVDPIVRIFELDRDIKETKLCRKFHHNLTLLSKVLV